MRSKKISQIIFFAEDFQGKFWKIKQELQKHPRKPRNHKKSYPFQNGYKNLFLPDFSVNKSQIY